MLLPNAKGFKGSFERKPQTESKAKRLPPKGELIPNQAHVLPIKCAIAQTEPEALSLAVLKQVCSGCND